MSAKGLRFLRNAIWLFSGLMAGCLFAVWFVKGKASENANPTVLIVQRAKVPFRLLPGEVVEVSFPPDGVVFTLKSGAKVFLGGRWRSELVDGERVKVFEVSSWRFVEGKEVKAERL